MSIVLRKRTEKRKEKKDFHFSVYASVCVHISSSFKKMGHEVSKRKDKFSKSSPPRTPGLSATKSEGKNVVQKHNLSNFAVVTVIFNPVKYKSRYDHYQKFETHMSQSGVLLITVECIFESAEHFGLPRQNFEVTRAGDRRHIQIIAPSIIWMKENLINIAIQRLPQNIEYVAWIDADIEFEVCIKEACEVFFSLRSVIMLTFY